MEKSIEYRRVDLDEPKSSSETEEDVRLMGGGPARVRQNRTLRRAWHILGASLVIIIYTTAVALMARRTVVKDDITHGGKIVKSLAADYVKHEIKKIDYLDWDDSGAYFGKPGKEVDANWHELMKYHNHGLPKSYMDEVGRTYQGVRFPDGKYFGSLMVFHHLHCLKHIYHALHPDYYTSMIPKDDEEKKQFTDHTEHCLGALKLYIMCKADITIETMKWDPKKMLPLHNVTSMHQCVRWDSILDYAKTNNEDVFAEGQLVHPTFGALFKDGKPVSHEHDH